MSKEPSMRAESDYRLLDEPHDSPQARLFEEANSSSDEQLLADYRQRYGLAEDPFTNDYSFPLFTVGGRRQLLEQLLHLCQFSSSLLLVLGEYGVGKTRTAHGFMDSLTEADTICFVSVRAGQTLEQLLLTVVQSLKLPLETLPTAENLLSVIEDFIASEQPPEEEGLAVVVLDDAHLLDEKTIQVITSLLQSFPQQTRLHFVCFGEYSLLARAERIGGASLLINDFSLQPFSLAETVDYLNFRMEMADYLGPEIFTESMVDPWWREAQGDLRVVHLLAQERLLESVMPKSGAMRRPLPVLHIIAMAMLITLVGVLFLYMDGDDKDKSGAAVPSVAAVNQPIAVPLPASTSATRERDLTRGDTPIEPILPSLPSLGQEPVVQKLTVAPEEVIPLAELPKSANNIGSGQIQLEKPEVAVAPAQVAQVTPAAPPAPGVSEVAQTSPKPAPAFTQNKPHQTESKNTGSSGKSAQEKIILAWPAAHYTIQLLGVSNAKAAQDYMAQQPNKSELLMFKSKRLGKDWFVVIKGHFASTAQARQAIAGLPSAQRDAGPWPRDLKMIQSEIRGIP